MTTATWLIFTALIIAIAAVWTAATSLNVSVAYGFKTGAIFFIVCELANTVAWRIAVDFGTREQ